ncbi:DNA-J related domain-containing protein [Nitrincola nitratireducens]|uniref:Chaperone protein DnaJ n=1 Tax=Nitrincola nitratireducens TaxID=1229521 RepID=W9V5I5_9GAMM|nr:DNA-J related domain-containing protein [Nitrincola nitratireducens]EXJ11352.1 chaperone protein DnaJ [Nitrincola nitratireducens]
MSDSERIRAIVRILEANPQGVSEFALLKSLQSDNIIHLDPDTFTDSLKLFQTHFLLFHHLYRLRDEWHEAGKGSLSIHTLSIQLRPYVQGDAGLVLNDPLRAYYLDLNELAKTEAEDVERLLHRFWRGLSQPVQSDERQQALSILGLENDVDASNIQKAWRQQAMALHPDRGGDAEQFKQVCWAKDVLIKRF